MGQGAERRLGLRYGALVLAAILAVVLAACGEARFTSDTNTSNADKLVSLGKNAELCMNNVISIAVTRVLGSISSCQVSRVHENTWPGKWVVTTWNGSWPKGAHVEILPVSAALGRANLARFEVRHFGNGECGFYTQPSGNLIGPYDCLFYYHRGAQELNIAVPPADESVGAYSDLAGVIIEALTSGT